MADVSQVSIGSTTYDIKDATAREAMIPTGGTEGQVLVKASDTDYDTAWGGQFVVWNTSTAPSAGLQGHWSFTIANLTGPDGAVPSLHDFIIYNRQLYVIDVAPVAGASAVTAALFDAFLPSSGTTGQVLTKRSDNNFDYQWTTPSSGGSQTTWYGTCSTGAGTAAKVVTCSGFTLSAGAIIGILFTAANTAATPTLNVNSTGAKSVYVGNGAINSTTNVLKWSANTMLYFMYDGTYFRYIGSVAAGGVVQPDGAGTWYGTCSTAAGTAAKASTITNFRLTQGALVAVTFTTANTVSGALTLNINSTGAKTIYRKNAATSASNVLTWQAKDTLFFIYSGSYWYYLGGSSDEGGSDTLELNLLLSDNGDNTGAVEVDLLQNGTVVDLVLLRIAADAGINLALAEDGDYHGGNLALWGSYPWNEVVSSTGSTSKTINLTNYSEVMVVADVLRNSAHHFFSVNMPIQAIGSDAAEYKLGGYVGANASTSGGAWCSMSLTSFAGVGSYINNTSFLTATTWTVYAR